MIEYSNWSGKNGWSDVLVAGGALSPEKKFHYFCLEWRRIFG